MNGCATRPARWSSTPPTARSCPPPHSTSSRPRRPATPERVPQRTCVGCRARRGQPELLRLAVRGDDVVIDRSAPGRGAWLCADTTPECFGRARRRALAAALRRPLPAGSMEALGRVFAPVRADVPHLAVARREPSGTMPTKG
ncbi:MAG: YlxR family protein [Acidimicrobiales bacterium]